MSIRTWAVVMMVAGGLIACGDAEEASGPDAVDASEAPVDGAAHPDTNVTPDAETAPPPDIASRSDAVEPLEGSDAEGSDAEGTDVEGSDAEGSDAEGSDVEGTDVEGSDVEGSDVEGSDVEGSDVEGSDVEGSDVEGSDAEGSDVEGSDAEGSVTTDVTSPEPDAEVLCVPECAGKTCGYDGCGGTCGACAVGETCNTQGTCDADAVCTPICAGKDCGDDGCGGSCGACPTGDLCTAGMCCAPGPHNDCECWTDVDCAAISDACEGAESCSETGSCEQISDSALACAEGLLCIDSACVDCDPSGTWELEATSASPPGQGCGPSGGPSQAPETQTYTLTLEADGSLLATPVEVAPEPEVTVTLVAGDPCSFAFSVTTAIDAPGSDDQEPGTTLVQFLYTGALNDGLYLGTGTVHTTFTTELGVVQQDCTEAISVSGTFMVAD